MKTIERYDLRIRIGDGWTEQQLQNITETYLRLARDDDDSHAEQQALLRAIAAHVPQGPATR